MAKTDSSQTSDRQRINRLWRDYIWPQKSRLFLAVFFMLVLALATAAYTSVIAKIVDSVSQLDDKLDAVNNAKVYAFAILPILLVITTLSGVSNYFQRILANALALNSVGDMQKQMFRSSLASDYASFAREPIGNRISKFTHDVTVVSNSLIRVLSNLIKDVLTVVFTIGFMLWHNWMLTLVMGIFLLAMVPIIEISKRMRGSAKDVQEHIGVITSELKESFSGTRMIKTYGLENRETSRLNNSFDQRISKFLKLVSQQARVDPILEVIGGLVIAGVVIFGVFQVSGSLATAGEVAAVLAGVLILSPRLRALGTLNNVAQEGLSSLTRIFDVIDETSKITDAPNARPLETVDGALSLNNVTFTYADGTQALDTVTLEAKPGETIALVGPSGGGKSTIINLIPRLYDVTDGAITIDGQDIRDVTLASLRGNIALVSQDITVFQDSIAANIGFGDLNASRDQIVDAAKAADAHDFISALPQGYDTIVGEDGDTLSGGQKQRIAIARAILRNAPVLLLDEATSALDAETESNVQTALERLSQGRTTITIAHRLSTVKKADRIYVLQDGQVVETGTHDSLSKTKDGLYARLRNLQFS